MFIYTEYYIGFIGTLEKTIYSPIHRKHENIFSIVLKTLQTRKTIFQKKERSTKSEFDADFYGIINIVESHTA